MNSIKAVTIVVAKVMLVPVICIGSLIITLLSPFIALLGIIKSMYTYELSKLSKGGR